jgi:ribose transport system permease protein
VSALRAVLAGRMSSASSQKLAVNVCLLVALCAYMTFAADSFLEWQNFKNVMFAISVTGIVAAAMTLVMISGGLDLSVGGVVAISGVVAALLAKGGAAIGLAFAAGIGVGALVGAVNALLIVSLNLNSVIATLGTLYVCRGVANLLTEGLPVNEVPPSWSELGTGLTFGIPTPALILAAVIAGLAIVQRYTLLGKHAIAVGSNFEAARLAGIRVDRVRIALYVMSGTLAGVGGIIVSSQLASGQPTAGTGLEFDAIVAAILGGTSLAGGEGSVVGALLGTLILGVLDNGLNLLGVQSFWQTVLQGVLLVGAVGVDALVRRRSGRYGIAALRRTRRAAAPAASTGDQP